jgi:hypothetical protein
MFQIRDFVAAMGPFLNKIIVASTITMLSTNSSILWDIYSGKEGDAMRPIQLTPLSQEELAVLHGFERTTTDVRLRTRA